MAMIGVACLASTALPALADGEGPFLNTDLGASFITGLPSGLTVDPGIRFSVVPGYRIYNDDIFGVSLQAETGLVWNQVSGNAHGDLYQVPFLAGFEYAFHTGCLVEPYIGVEGGGVYADFDYYNFSHGKESSVSGAVEGMAGVRFKLSDSAELGVGYKFMAAFPSGYDYLGTHAVSLTFVLRF